MSIFNLAIFLGIVIFALITSNYLAGSILVFALSILEIVEYGMTHFMFLLMCELTLPLFIIRETKLRKDNSPLLKYNRLDAGCSLTLSNGLTFTRNLMRDGYRRSLVTGISSVANGVGVGSLVYAYDALNRPTSRNADTFGYNVRGEVTATTIDGNAEAHEYDSIGNSILFSFNDMTNTFSANNLNQYTSILRASAPPRVRYGVCPQGIPVTSLH